MTKKKWIICGTALLVLLSIIATIIGLNLKKVNNKLATLDAETLKSMTYSEITDKDSKIDNCEYVQFSAFFTRDLNGDGNAEKLNGTCKNVNSTDFLYIDLNVQTDGYLKDGVITINSNNFKYNMKMIKDDVLKNNYISDDVKKIELNNVNAGTEKLIIGNILANIQNDTNNYSNTTSITLTGTHVSDENVETPINKTMNIETDWYGTTTAKLYTDNFYYDYNNLQSETTTFSVKINEIQEELILKENEVTLTIPKLNEYSPLDVKCTNSNVESEYDESTGVLKIKRSSKIDENGIVTDALSRYNTYTVSVTYPKEAYEKITSYTELHIPVSGYYTGYNNKNEQFQNPYQSNIENGNIVVIFRETPKGKIYNFYVDFMDKRTVYQPYKRSVISKQDILNLYDSEDSVKSKEYTVRWTVSRGSEGEVPSIIMSETKKDDNYGDKWDNLVMQEYTVNTGIYFTGADYMLGENGTISVYDNDTNKLIKEFTKDEWNTYTTDNPYKYENSIKHIRVETSSANLNTNLSVYNIKELNLSKILQDFSKGEVKNVNLIYTYLTGICNIQGQKSETVNDIDSAYYVSETSNAEISISTKKISTQETLKQQKIYISAVNKQTGDANWKNGEFIVEIPEQFINVNVNYVSTNNAKVKIVAYDLFKKDGKYLIKVITENTDPTTYNIIINCDMTPDPRISSTTQKFNLYAYNEYCNEYYRNIKDIYDVNDNNSINDNVGTDSVAIDLLAPTSLITLETISNYNENNEITIAPNVAEVSRKTRRAKINVSLTNNYTNTVSDINILGKIPFEGNTYILNEKTLNSKFTTTMTDEGVNVPSELQEKTLVYYSTNDNPNNNLNDTSNGWTLKENIQDFSKVKTYLICINENSMEKGKEYKFNYDINIPEGISYNLASYSTHTVYYKLNTDGGALNLSTEPNKVGVRIAKKISLNLTKYKMNSNLKISGVTYQLKWNEENTEGQSEEKSKILTTNNEGNLICDDLYGGKTYTLQEIKVPETCELNDEEFKFEVTENTNGEIVATVKNGNAKLINIQNENIVNLELEDEVRYELNLLKTDGTNNLNGVRFKLLEDGQQESTIYTTVNGNINIKGLYINRLYTVQEINANGCYLDSAKDNTVKFKIIRNSQTKKLEVETWIVGDGVNQIGTQTISEDENKITPILSFTLKNDKIPTYNFGIIKVNNDGEKLKSTGFKLTSIDTNETTTIFTDSEGKANINNLYEYVENKYITGEYILEEISATEGYAINSTKFKFKCTRNASGKLIMYILEGSDLIQNKDMPKDGNIYNKDGVEVNDKNIAIEDDKAIVTIENKPIFNLTKKDSETGKLLPNAKFKISSLDGADVQGTDGKMIGQDVTYDVNTWSSTTTYKWTKRDDGTYQSNNQAKNNSTSTIIYDFTLNAPGKLSFDWSVSSEEKSDYLYYNIVNNTTGEQINGTNDDISGTSRGTNYESLTFDNKQFDLTAGKYQLKITYRKNNKTNEGLDTAYVKNVRYTINSVIKTNENGKISLNLGQGLYKLIEVEAPEGYDVPENLDDRTYTFGIGETNLEYVLSWDISTQMKLYNHPNWDENSYVNIKRIVGVFYINSEYVVFQEQRAANRGLTYLVKWIISKEGKIVECIPIQGSEPTMYGGEFDDEGNFSMCYDEKADVFYYSGKSGFKMIKGSNIYSVSEYGTDSTKANKLLVINDRVYRSMYEDGEYSEIVSYGFKETSVGTHSEVVSNIRKEYKDANETVGGVDIVQYSDNGIASIDTGGNIFLYDLDLNLTRKIPSPEEFITWNSNDDKTPYGKLLYNDGYFYLFSRNKMFKMDLNGNVIYQIKYAESIDKHGAYSSRNPSYSLIPVDITSDEIIIGDIVGSNIKIFDKNGNLMHIQNVTLRLQSSYSYLSWYISEIKATDNNEFVMFSGPRGNQVQDNYSGYPAVFKYYKYEVTSPALQEITVENTLKQYNITTEIGINSENTRAGGTITGEYNGQYLESKNIKFVETVKHGANNTINIIATPSENYSISKITINGVETNFVVDSNGTITIPAGYFNNITEDKHIVVTFEKGISNILVHHYLKDSNGVYTTTSVADDEYYTGKIGDLYTTSPKTDLLDYELEKDSKGEYVVPSNATGIYTNEQQVITYYYEEKPVILTVHHYLEGTETKLDDDVIEKHKKGENYKTEISQRALEDYEFSNVNGQVQGVITEDKVVTYYYKIKEFKITTDVIEHTENYKDGTVKENVKGGKISGEDELPYETVLRGENPKKEIKITPTCTKDKFDNVTEEYKIIKIVIKQNKEDETGTELDITKLKKQDDGSIILPQEYLVADGKGMQSNKHVEVEFRKKTNIIIKYLEKNTENVLYQTPDGKNYEQVIGYEGQNFETARRAILNYKIAESQSITNENNQSMKVYNNIDTDEKTYVNGQFYADTITIIYWYEKIPAGISVKHIEIDENDIKNGLTLNSGTILDEEEISGYVGFTKNISRKTYDNTQDDKYKNLISVNGPENTSENIIIASKDENNKNVEYKQDEIVEVRYYYERQYNVTTQVKPHEETVLNPDTKEYETKLVDGGTISKEYITDEGGSRQEIAYELINRMGYNKKQIEIIPDKGYRVKEITINDIKYAQSQLKTDEGNKVIIPAGTDESEENAFFKNVTEDKHIVVEFEKIPAKVIVEYKDVYTKEQIEGVATKIISGFVGDDYDEQRLNIENYISADPEPTNNKGKMTEEDIVVVYWYNKQFKITTDVIEHKEKDDNGNIILKKGGKITAEDEDPYEIVIRGNNNTKDIEIEPDEEYEIRQIKINGTIIDYKNDKDITKEENKVKIPKDYFKDIQENKHIEVEFGKRPAKITVKNLEDGTDEPLTEDSTANGYVGDEYKTKPADIKYYELVKERYPKNSEGKLAEEETVVIYYYKKLTFNMKIEKDVNKITVNGQELNVNKNEISVVTLDYEKVKETTIKVEYKIKVTNTEKIAGKATIEEDIPEGFDFAEENDKKWKKTENKYILQTEEINPGETKEYIVILNWKQDTQNKGKKTNNVQIVNTENEPKYEETTIIDNKDNATVEIKINKKIKDVVDDIKNGNTQEVIKDITRNIKTGDSVIIFIMILSFASTILAIVLIKRRK